MNLPGTRVDDIIGDDGVAHVERLLGRSRARRGNVASAPVLLVDMDGPMAHFDQRLWDLCVVNGWPLDITDMAEQRHRYSTDHIVDPAHRSEARRLIAEDERWFADLEPVPGAIEGIHELAVHFDVWLCTKPLEANVNCRDGKAEWVRRHLRGDWERKLIITPDKSMIRGDILLDDGPKIEWFPKATWRPVIFAMSFNGPGSEWDGLPRWTWGDPIGDLVSWARRLDEIT